MTRLSFLLAVGIGYAVGARAGQRRYDDAVVRAARTFAERPEVQEVAGVVTAQAGALLRRASSRGRSARV